MDTFAWPSWSAIWRADRPARSSSVAAVLRNTWLVTHENSAEPRALRRSREVFEAAVAVVDVGGE